ncbi:hypothetical protein ABT120_60620 [Nonomuraea angiospora]|uniref:WD40 repeat domain-containing protein n=1 Tax=Nonomuraea angiospora TaxID=46172 RepID=UPI00332DF0E4
MSNPAKPTALGKPLTGHTGAVTSVAFRPDGRTLASGGGEGDRAIRLWDITDPARARPTGEPLTGHSADVESLAYAPNDQTIASAGERPMLWNLDDKQAIRHICQYTGNSLSREEWRHHIGAEIPFTPACP